MTTIIAQDSAFVAADHLWTDEEDLPAEAPFKKFYVMNDSILFFSGYIDPILAVLAGYLGDAIDIDADHAQWMAKAAEIDGKTCEIIEVERKTGAVVYHQGASKREECSLVFYGAGSGSDYALDTYVNSVGILSKAGKDYNFPEYGECFLRSSMNCAFRQDCCSGGDFSYIAWHEEMLLTDLLDWPKGVDVIENYNYCIRTKIFERFDSKDELIALVSMFEDELRDDAKELEIETKIFDQGDVEGYNSKPNLAAKGRSTMSNTTQEKPRVAVKTSGSARGTVLSASSLQARLAQRKAEGLS